jgi:hypothetical protein
MRRTRAFLPAAAGIISAAAPARALAPLPTSTTHTIRAG